MKIKRRAKYEAQPRSGQAEHPFNYTKFQTKITDISGNTKTSTQWKFTIVQTLEKFRSTILQVQWIFKKYTNWHSAGTRSISIQNENI